jgi:SAM-dependent methyltransferase
MRQNLLEYICCPITHEKLEIKSIYLEKDGNVLNGKLISSSGVEFIIADGIPNLIPKSSQIESETIQQFENKSYVSILHKIGYNAIDIAQMDLLRYSIFSKIQFFMHNYLRGIVLEIGAGENYLKKCCSASYTEWVSLDYNVRSDSIDVLGDGQQLPFKDNVFDTIISVDVLEHVPNPEMFISEMFRVIKPNGVVILSTPFFFYLHESPNDFFRFSKFGLQTLFDRIGFKVIEVTPIAGVISIIGILTSILFTKVFSFSKVLLKLFLRINRFVQIKLLLPIDKLFDKDKRFAQGHFIIAKKIISTEMQ